MESKIYKQNIIAFNLGRNELFQYKTKDLSGDNIVEKDFFTSQVNFVNFDSLCYVDDRNGNYLILNNKVEIEERGFDKAFFNLGNSVGFQMLENGEIFTGVYTPVNFKTINEVYSAVFLFNNDTMVYLKSLQEIVFWNYISDDYNDFPLIKLGTWKDTLEEKPYQVAAFCGIWENTLVCTMNNGAVLLLDIEKGEVKALLKDAQICHYLTQIDNGPIFQGLYHCSFVKIDVEQQKIIQKVNLTPEWLRVGRTTDLDRIGPNFYSGGLHYFIANTNIVGIFNPETCQIVDYHVFKFKIRHQQIRDLQAKDGKMYCLDTEGNLYELESDKVPPVG